MPEYSEKEKADRQQKLGILTFDPIVGHYDSHTGQRHRMMPDGQVADVTRYPALRVVVTDPPWASARF